MTKASDNIYPRLLVSEGGSTATPASGNVTVYAKADGLLYSKDDAGTETPLGGGSGVPDQGTVTYFDFTTAAAPASPAAGKIRVYSKTGDALSQKTSGGTETVFGAGGGLAHSFAGYNTVGGSTETLTGNRQYMKKITLAAAAQLLSIDIYLDATATDPTAFLVGLLADTAGLPTNVLAINSGGADAASALGLKGGNAARWVSFPLAPYVAAGDYWLAFTPTLIGSSGIRIAYDTSGADRYFDIGPYIIDGDHAATTDSTRKYSIRAAILS